jgi:hypothetical protein
MRFSKRYAYDKFSQDLRIGEVVERAVAEAPSYHAGEIESLLARQEALISVVARMAQELSPEGQESLANHFGFDVAEEEK